ncbi:hypothetical protein AYI68_g5295 [Smittium mucronatum]|uniref:Uncharacterized protein n=1 Tax=Smittium mucronatum TaxID=133383 RepID=A0A1R0GUM9_9FUNG|nr:hypothetical protein AYI68_g5295 [Smittium mucronatum]
MSVIPGSFFKILQLSLLSGLLFQKSSHSYFYEKNYDTLLISSTKEGYKSSQKKESVYFSCTGNDFTTSFKAVSKSDVYFSILKESSGKKIGRLEGRIGTASGNWTFGNNLISVEPQYVADTDQNFTTSIFSNALGTYLYKDIEEIFHISKHYFQDRKHEYNSQKYNYSLIFSSEDPDATIYNLGIKCQLTKLTKKDSNSCNNTIPIEDQSLSSVRQMAEITSYEPFVVPCADPNFKADINFDASSDISVIFSNGGSFENGFRTIEAVVGLVTNRSTLRMGTYISLKRRDFGKRALSNELSISYQLGILSFSNQGSTFIQVPVNNFDIKEFYLNSPKGPSSIYQSSFSCDAVASC